MLFKQIIRNWLGYSEELENIKKGLEEELELQVNKQRARFNGGLKDIKREVLHDTQTRAFDVVRSELIKALNDSFNSSKAYNDYEFVYRKIDRMIKNHVSTEVEAQVGRYLDNRLKPEEFIDDIVKRIKTKQL